ncbi:NepR family anti-sigma factor [Salipiger bermudensis]|uniref:NepR family anti-sigma factor n=1 Tax=Salipiger bermudensis TaxID=344736 RepID=UPI003008AFEC
MGHTRRNYKEAEVIDENLRRVYQDMLDEKVPDRFLDLIAQLKSQDDDGSATGGDAK